MPQKAKTQPMTREQLAQRIYTIGCVHLQIEDVETRMNKRLDAIRAQYADQLEALRAEHDRLMTALRVAAEDSRDHLLLGDGKTVDTLFGSVQYRRQPVTVRLRAGTTTAAAVEALKRNDLDAYVRQVEALDKTALNGAAREGALTAAQAGALGLVVSGGHEDVLVSLNRDRILEERGD